MIVKAISITGFRGKRDSNIKVVFHPDINILTGRNGSGKTTLLKLVWYIISGNIEHAISEVPFDRVFLETSDYTVEIKKGQSNVFIRIDVDDDVYEFSHSEDEDDDDPFAEDPAISADGVIKDIGSSIFFPTFRRIEGGFSVGRGRRRASLAAARAGKYPSGIDGALQELSDRLTVSNHTFVAAIATSDIAEFLLRNFAKMSEQASEAQKALTAIIVAQIRSYEPDSSQRTSLNHAEKILEEVRQKAEQMDAVRTEAFAPFDAVKALVIKLFSHSGIRFAPSMSFGDAADAVNSDALSAGEKQMLSFVCYNAFQKNSVFFIDEPELSLHVDWQRTLLPTLQSQNTSNQFIVSTHSPFIYTKYPDREIMVSDDRGYLSTDIVSETEAG
jgi:predicted ATPase